MTNDSGVLTVTPPVAFTGGVQVAMYDTHNPGDAFDWYDYTSATIDAANPARLTLDTAASFAPRDRVQLRYRSRDFKEDVTAVSGQVVELESPVTVQDNEFSIRIAKVGSRDPLGNADSAAMVEMGMGWMKWVFDPYGQIEYAVDARAEWAQWLLRVMRWVLGTQNFSLLPFGYLWWGRLFPIREEHRAEIEQQASEQSGDLYSPLGRLTGEISGSGFAARSMVVGDIARYRYWPDDRTARFVSPRNDPTTTRGGGRLDAPGVWLRQDLRVMADRTGGAASADPNLDNQMDATREPGGRSPRSSRSGPAIPGDREQRPPARGEPAGVRSVRPRQRAHLGTDATHTRRLVAFTREGSHRVTTVNGIAGCQGRRPRGRRAAAALLRGDRDRRHRGRGRADRRRR